MKSINVGPLDSVITAKIPRDVADRLRESARTNDRTISGELRRVLKDWAERTATSSAERPGR